MKTLLLVTKIVSLIVGGVCAIFLIMWQMAPRDTDELLKEWHIPLKEGTVFAIALVFVVAGVCATIIDDKYFRK